MRNVLDTNVLVRANIKTLGPARELLLKIAEETVRSGTVFAIGAPKGRNNEAQADGLG
jgi:hypothetical protein